MINVVDDIISRYAMGQATKCICGGWCRWWARCLGGIVWNVFPDMGKPILTVDREARLNKMEGVIWAVAHITSWSWIVDGMQPANSNSSTFLP